MTTTTEAGSHLAANTVLRRAFLFSLSCAASAVVVGGIGGRIVMGISAAAAGPDMVGRMTENGNRVGEFTVVGTLFLIVFIGIFVALLGTAVVVGSDPWLRWMGPLQGLGFGVTVLALNGQQDNFGSTDFLILNPASLNIAMFVTLNILFGIAVAGIHWILDKRVPPAATTAQPLWAVAAIFYVMGFLLLMAFLILPGFSGSDANYQMGAIMAVLGASTAIRTASCVVIQTPRWLDRTVNVSGYGSMAMLVAVGLTRTADQIQRLI